MKKKEKRIRKKKKKEKREREEKASRRVEKKKRWREGQGLKPWSSDGEWQWMKRWLVERELLWGEEG